MVKQKDGMQSKTGILFMLIGTALVTGALVLFLWNRYDADRGAKEAQEVLPRLIQALPTQEALLSGQEEQAEAQSEEMTVVEIEGYGYIGYLTIPALELELPVMSKWSYPQLKIAPCRYTGSVKTGNLVIAAHNYARHFGRLRNLAPGDPVYFTDMDGIVRQYEVAEVETLTPTAIGDMTAGEYELTLFTCTYGGRSRVTVRCAEVF